jgi:hypothetical protein
LDLLLETNEGVTFSFIHSSSVACWEAQRYMGIHMHRVL